MTKIPLVLALGLLVCSVGMAAPIVVDAFGTTQTVTVAAGAPPLSEIDTIAAPDALGGFRTVDLERLSGGGPTSTSVNSIGNDLLDMNVGAADTATLQLIYDGDNSDAFNTAGLGSVDLTDGGSNLFFLIPTRSDLGGTPLLIEVWSGAGNVSEAMFTVASTGFGANPFTQNYVNFSSFTTSAGSGADFTNISALRITVGDGSVAGVDVQIGEITASVPEPTTILLTGAGLLIAGLLARKRRMTNGG